MVTVTSFLIVGFWLVVVRVGGHFFDMVVFRDWFRVLVGVGLTVLGWLIVGDDCVYWNGQIWVVDLRSLGLVKSPCLL